MKPDSASVVLRHDVRVMFLRTTFPIENIQRSWDRLEQLVSTRGRKFYGAIDPPTGEYWVCVEAKPGDDPGALGLESGVLPGGRYLRAKLRGEPPEVYDRIGPTFDALEKSMRPDPTRPSIEFYRERDEIDCLLPV
ncbi:MAG TPA: GyrI-like domain-containing protein [Candidatus Dormibacteraeota bacterium]|nr:GyrI-like domain-containing protein [Candidatus Dormibacteraeota bacterium]